LKNTELTNKTKILKLADKQLKNEILGYEKTLRDWDKKKKFVNELPATDTTIQNVLTYFNDNQKFTRQEFDPSYRMRQAELLDKQIHERRITNNQIKDEHDCINQDLMFDDAGIDEIIEGPNMDE
jgi:hypothetical protein